MFVNRFTSSVSGYRLSFIFVVLLEDRFWTGSITSFTLIPGSKVRSLNLATGAGTIR